MAQRIRKMIQSAPIVGKIFNDLSLNSDIDAPSINAVKEHLFRPNLLVNGDFQCWQRGNSITINSTKSNGSNYFCDMWYMYHDNSLGYSTTFDRVSNGMKITTDAPNIYINQKLPDILELNKDYIMVVSINNIVYTSVIKCGTSSTSDHTEYVYYSGTTYPHRIIFRQLLNNDVINYVALYEGSMAYPHVKEDYATALDRCQEWVQIYSEEVQLWFALIDARYYEHHLLTREMRYNPTVQTIGIWYPYGTVDVKNTHTISANRFKIEVTADSSTNAKVVVTARCLLTCEPL